ncbi:hypothetical protein BN126330125 [Stenotrophomonas thermophila]|nr:hypothetical protein BN126330125 [Stenotrophomonas maltophilia]
MQAGRPDAAPAVPAIRTAFVAGRCLANE